uniref:Uncharacterized protein n=1 Tax=Rhizophora mucronata TaxID=61149 RepID=A0A2P2QNG0_RHIMU
MTLYSLKATLYHNTQ